jgi:N-acyl-D-amino-acid deacylase
MRPDRHEVVRLGVATQALGKAVRSTWFNENPRRGALARTCLAIAGLAWVTLPAGAGGDEAPYDLVIRGGRIVDGTGNPWSRGDVAIRGDRIVAVGRLDEAGVAAARRVVDATGRVVAPGFIDMHSHSDRALFLDGAAPSKVRQGVTTEVLGEQTSGGPYLGALGPQEVTVAGQSRPIRRLKDYLDALDDSGIAVNAASYVGLGNVWGGVMGSSFARPTAEQLGRMKAILAEAMEDGAFGLSDALASPDAEVVTTEDLVELGRVVGRYGGIYSTHIRNEGSDVFGAIGEAIAVGERAGIPVDIIHLKIADRKLWGRMDEIIATIESARGRGVNVQANVYPYTRGNNDLVSIVPPWAHEGGRPELLARLKDPAQRQRMTREIREGLPGWYNHYLAVGGDWGRMLVSARLSEPNRRFQGQTMDRILAERAGGRTLDEAGRIGELFDFLVEEGGTVGTIYAHHTEEDMNRALVQPWCSIGSDGAALAIEGPLRSVQGHPHPRNFGTFPRVLGVYVREKGLLRLEDAVRKMTSLNTAKIGLVDRGLLRPGQFADVTVFDPGRVIDRATYLDPFQYPEGIEAVVVNGRVVLDGGRPTEARPGRALRRGRDGTTRSGTGH